MTYLDEDGDEITISTDSELAEAFEQFVDKIPPVLRATAVVQPGRKASPSKPRPNGPSMEANLEHFQTLRDSITEIRDSAKFKAEQFKNTTPRERMEHVTNVLDSIIMVLGQALEALSKNVEQVRTPARNRQMNMNRQNQGRPCGRPNGDGLRGGGLPQARPCGRPNQAGPRGRQGAGPNGRRTEAEKKKISQQVMKKVLADVIEKERKQKSVVTEGFIHGRHTCDGCLVTPIVGIRHHATNVPDYDLCSKCFPNYKGREIVFAPEELGTYYRSPFFNLIDCETHVSPIIRQQIATVIFSNAGNAVRNDKPVNPKRMNRNLQEKANRTNPLFRVWMQH